METIPKANCAQIGFIRKTHGVHGELILEYEPEYERSFDEAERLFLDLEGLLVPFFISENGFRFRSSKSAIITFDGVDTEDYARRLVGNTVWLFKNEVVFEENETTVSRFVDFLLEDEELGKLGKITSVDDFSGNLVLNVDYCGDVVLVPYNEDFLVSIDEEQKVLKLNLPHGLIDV